MPMAIRSLIIHYTPMLQSLAGSKTFNCPFPGGQIQLSDTLVCLHIKTGLCCPLPVASTHNPLPCSHTTQQPPVLSPTLCTQPSRPGLLRVSYYTHCCTHSTVLPCSSCLYALYFSTATINILHRASLYTPLLFFILPTSAPPTAAPR